MQNKLVLAALAAVMSVGFVASTSSSAEAAPGRGHHMRMCKVDKVCRGHGRHRHCRIVRVCKRGHGYGHH